PLADLLAADLKLNDPSLVANDFRWLRTAIDGAVITRAPRDLLAEAPQRPVIIGSNRAEFGPGPGEVDWDKQLPAIFGPNAAKAREFYREGDPRMGHPELIFMTDWVFRCPAGRVADLLAGRGAPVWRYEWDVTEDGGRTTHSAELGWVFGGKTFSAGGQAISLTDYWVNFATTGNPNGALPRWPAYTARGRGHVLFDAKGVTPQTALREPICSMLEEL
ncbi:MAG: carboxylesterase family protein, partial [Sphingomonas sp.]